MMAVDWLWPMLDGEETRLLQDCIAAFEAPNPDRTLLSRKVDSVQKLEKQFVPQNPTQLSDPILKERILVATVGFRELPVILTTLILRPAKLYLLHSSESRGAAEKVRDDPYVQAIGLHPTQDVILREISLVDAPTNYAMLQKILDENSRREMVVDISGGVKVMGTSLAAAAFWLRIPVVYLLGDEVNGIIKPFSERLMSLINPFIYFGSAELRSLKDLFSVGEYDAALALTQNLRNTVGDVQTLGKFELLDEFIQLYRDWDSFKHSNFEETEIRKLATRLRVVTGKMNRFSAVFAQQTQIEANLKFLIKLEETWKSAERNNSELYRLVDIYVAAQRRAKAGKYDDAVARLYRCLEMGASICLVRDCGIDNVQNPNWAEFSKLTGSIEQLQVEFEKKARYPLRLDAKLGLKDQMTLLQFTKNKAHKRISDIYQGMEGGHLMEKRNRSILAHGTVPVSKQEFEQFHQKTLLILQDVVGESFDSLQKQATHPDLEIDMIV